MDELIAALLEHGDDCMGDTTIEIVNRKSVRMHCIGIETSSLMECGWSKQITKAD
jgi:hypothetical protein